VRSWKITNKNERSSRDRFKDVVGDVLPEGFQIYGLDRQIEREQPIEYL